MLIALLALFFGGIMLYAGIKDCGLFGLIAGKGCQPTSTPTAGSGASGGSGGSPNSVPPVPTGPDQTFPPSGNPSPTVVPTPVPGGSPNTVPGGRRYVQ